MINVNFSDGVNVVTTINLFQWDTYQTINLSGVTASEVHFANKKSTEALCVSIVNNSVSIPNTLLQEKYDIIGYIYLENGVGGQTIKTIKIPVEPRLKPSDYTEVTDEDIVKIQEIELEARAIIDNLTASEYTSGATYQRNNIVYYNGNAYMCKVACTGVSPSNTTNWQLICKGACLTSLSKDTNNNLVFNYSDGTSYTVQIATTETNTVDSTDVPALLLTSDDVRRIKSINSFPMEYYAISYLDYPYLEEGLYHVHVLVGPNLYVNDYLMLVGYNMKYDIPYFDNYSSTQQNFKLEEKRVNGHSYITVTPSSTSDPNIPSYTKLTVTPIIKF